MRALTRNTLLALPVTVLLDAALPASFDLLDAFTLAFAFTMVGYFVETALLKLPGIETAGGKLIRMLGWFAGGLWCYVLGRWALLAYGRNTSELPSLIWGGVFFVALQLMLHGILQATGKPNFYSGQLEETSAQ